MAWDAGELYFPEELLRFLNQQHSIWNPQWTQILVYVWEAGPTMFIALLAG